MRATLRNVNATLSLLQQTLCTYNQVSWLITSRKWNSGIHLALSIPTKYKTHSEDKPPNDHEVNQEHNKSLSSVIVISFQLRNLWLVNKTIAEPCGRKIDSGPTSSQSNQPLGNFTWKQLECFPFFPQTISLLLVIFYAPWLTLH